MSRLVLLVCLVLLSGCLGGRKQALVTDRSSQWAAWCGQPAELRLRHNVLAEYDGANLTAESFMTLDPAKGAADVVLLNPMGIKLAVLRVTQTEVLLLQQPSILPREQAEMYGLALRRAFLLAWPCFVNGLTDVGGARADGVRTNVDVDTGMIMKIEVHSGAERWTVARGNGLGGTHSRLPQSLTVHDHQTRFTLTLWQTQAGSNE